MKITRIIIQSSIAWGGALYTLPIENLKLSQLLALLKKSQRDGWRVTFETNEGGILFPIVVAYTLELWASENLDYIPLNRVQRVTRFVRGVNGVVSDNAIYAVRTRYAELYQQFSDLFS